MGAVPGVPAVDVRRAADRMRTRTGWLDSRHSFSFGPHYDPANTHFGLLVANNSDVVRPGGGFDTHPHRDLEIVTWVLAGSLVHRDSTGRTGVLRPGLVQRVSAGSGVLHSERNAGREDVHLVQMWLLPDTDGVDPGYEQRDVGPALDAGEPVVVASGLARHRLDRAVSLRQEQAGLHAARLRPGATAPVPAAPFVHLFVARGSLTLEGVGPLHTGDAARITSGDGRRAVAGPEGAETLVWEMYAAVPLSRAG